MVQPIENTRWQRSLIASKSCISEGFVLTVENGCLDGKKLYSAALFLAGSWV